MNQNNIKINSLLEHINSLDSNITKESFWQELSQISKSYEQGLDGTLRRSTGIYYTDLVLATYMIDEMFNLSLKSKLDKLDSLTFFEPCVGVGNFVFAYLKKISELNLSNNIIKKILNNIYVCDIDDDALSLYKQLFIKFSKIFFNIEVTPSSFENKLGNGLLFNLNKGTCDYINIKDIFNEIHNNGGFDIIVTNPPYKNLKAEKNKYSSTKSYEKDKENYKFISDYAKTKFKYSNNGVLNLYKLFVEEIVCTYSKPNAIISLLIPSTILTDKSCEKLRTMLLENHALKSINTIRENSGYIDAQQALCTLLFEKGEKTNEFQLNTNLTNSSSDKCIIMKYKDIKNLNMGNSIFTINSSDYAILNKLRTYPTVKDLSFIINMRGELDLTANKSNITGKVTDYILLRGKNIAYYKLTLNKKLEYVTSDFVTKSHKASYINSPRIICQQIANIHKERRITFAYIPQNYILGNSCNFMSVLKNDYNFDIFALLGIMNSTLINWLFKVTSSNNHINNYELDMLPIPIESRYLETISKLVQEYIKSYDDTLLTEIDKLVNDCYKLTTNTDKENLTLKTSDNKLAFKFLNELNLMVNRINFKFNYEDVENLLNENINIECIFTNKGIVMEKFNLEALMKIIEKYRKMKKGIVLNHTTFKLSNLDLEMVRSVPQGGNWKNIPDEVVSKSQRLIKINQTGGRTTLYGRIDYTKPSYTITTYFNRPGNGTYIHPIHDRVLSVREAARFQSFKDDYFFTGNKSNLLSQVGNAVPPLLAYSIANKIRSKVDCTTSIDLFCGAGGMTVGFKEAGIKSIVGLDFDRSACLTLKINNPEINVICDDITKSEVKNKIVDIANTTEIDMICGGPPCQGFSHAGKRFVDDPRNQLFKDYIELVSRIKPKFVVMENVHGMLTFLKGEIYAEIVDLFSSLGYKTEGRLLLASEYGVPQKRKRLILICVRNDINVLPEELFPEKTTPEPESQISAFDAISDLENVDCDENALYNDTSTTISNYAKTMKCSIPFNTSHTIATKEYVAMTKASDKKNKHEVINQLNLFELLI